MKETIKKALIFWLVSSVTMILVWLTYAAVYNSVNNWETLTASMWNNIHNYSTEEINTWKKWIDGRPIFRKVIDFWVLPASWEKSVAHWIDFDAIISTYGYAKSTSGLIVNFPSYVWPSTINSVIWTYYDWTNVYIWTWNDRSSYTETYIVIEYVK